MNLYLVRHADAIDIGQRGVQRDSDRMLTDKGIRQTMKIAEFLKAQGIVPGAVVASPFVRARQTAEALTSRLAPSLHVTVVDDLRPGGSPAACLRSFNRISVPSLIAVGHMPDIAQLAALLATGAEGRFMDFKKCAVAAFKVDGAMIPGAGALQWFVRPRIVE